MNETLNLDEPYVIKLRKPVKLGEVTWDSLTLTEPTGTQMEAASGISNPATSNIVLISVVAEVPEAAIRKIGWRDINRAAKYLENFTVDGQLTGATPSPK